MNEIILSANNIAKTFNEASKNSLTIFKNLNLQVKRGETISIVGSSGSGKTSLLQILAGLDKATAGQIYLCGENLNNLNRVSESALRNKYLGFIYQFHHLLPEFTALENTLMPLIISGSSDDSGKTHALQVLTSLGLEHRVNHYPSELSGGERQRVAIARAVVNKPQIVFADEPTGNLDNFTAHQVLDVFLELRKELSTSLLIVTHDLDIAAKTITSYTLHNGLLKQIR